MAVDLRRRMWPSFVQACVLTACAWLAMGCSKVARLEPEKDADPCEAIECTQPPEPGSCYLPTGTCEDGVCAYAFDEAAACDDGDACTTGDTCASGSCSGEQVACEARPPECADHQTLRTYDVGSCAAGACTHVSSDETCPNGCAAGQCNPVRPMISIGYMHTCAVSGTGRVRCWGANHAGQLGYGHTETIGDDELPSEAGDVDVGGVVTQIGAGYAHTCALLDTGAVRCWGEGGGMFSYPRGVTIGDDETPASAGDVDIGGPAKQIAVGFSHTCALLDNGTVRCWGMGGGALGYGHTETIGDDEAPASAGDVDVGGAVSQVSAGNSVTCVLLTTGGLRCFGVNFYGRLGYGNLDNVGDDETPASAGDVPVGANVLQVAADSGQHASHACALVDGGAVVCWGQGSWGAPGYGTLDDIGDDETPASIGNVEIDEPVVQIATGGTHTCALLQSGAMRCWGNNGAGQLGGGSKEEDVPVAGDVAMIACGGGSTCALAYDGAVRCWGDNQLGELGYGHTEFIHDAAAVGAVSIW
jgi:alpha-tubulin suppressor-like RCC1 family protein